MFRKGFTQEELFVSMLILHLVSVHEAIKHGMYIELSGLRKDVCQFFSLPIPSSVWAKMKALQNREFVAFVEACREESEVFQLLNTSRAGVRSPLQLIRRGRWHATHCVLSRPKP